MAYHCARSACDSFTICLRVLLAGHLRLWFIYCLCYRFFSLVISRLECLIVYMSRRTRNSLSSAEFPVMNSPLATMTSTTESANVVSQAQADLSPDILAVTKAAATEAAVAAIRASPVENIGPAMVVSTPLDASSSGLQTRSSGQLVSCQSR